MFPNFAAAVELFGRELLIELLGNPGHVQRVPIRDDPWGRGVPIALLESPSPGIRRLMVGPLRCGGLWPRDHELSCLLLTVDSELIWLDLPIKRLEPLRDGADLPAASDDADIDDFLEFGFAATPSDTTPHRDWRLPGRWSVPDEGKLDQGVLGAWYRLMRRRAMARGQGELMPAAFLSELHRRIDRGVDWVIDGLPSLHAALVRERSIDLPLVNRLLEQAKEHPHPDAERFAHQALKTLPLGLLDALVFEQDAWRDTLLSGGRLGKVLQQDGITPALYRLLLRDPSRPSVLADELTCRDSWQIACKALRLIDPADWPRTTSDQARFVDFIRMVFWEGGHELGHRLIAWAWTPGVQSALGCVRIVRKAARELVQLDDPLSHEDEDMLPFIEAIVACLPPISRTPRAQRHLWAKRLEQKLQSRRVQRQLWHAAKGADVVPTAERLLGLARVLPQKIELPGVGWFVPQHCEQALKVLGTQVGNCLAEQQHALHYLGTGHVIGRVENQQGDLLGVLAINVREALAGSSDETVCEWQRVGRKRPQSQLGVLAGGLAWLRTLVKEGARAQNTFNGQGASDSSG